MTPDNREEQVREALDLRFKSGNAIPVERTHITATEWATIRAHIEALEADAKDSARQDVAVWNYLQSVSPWSPSNDMDWCDEIITGIDCLRERADNAEARVRELEGVLRDAPTTLAYAINMCNGVASEALQDEAMRRVNAYNARVKAAMQGEEVRGG